MRKISLCVALMLGAIWFATSANANGVVEPTYGAAVVDGAYGEWDLTQDFFCAMYRDGDPAGPLTAKLYLRYDCLTGTMYVLVLTEPGAPALIRPYDAWIQVVGRNGHVFDGDPLNDGPPSDFAWVNLVTNADWPYAWGFEGKFPLFEGLHELIVRLTVFEGFQIRTSATAGYPDHGCWVTIDCGPTPTVPATWGRIKQTYH
jgi:hypothetical protein